MQSYAVLIARAANTSFRVPLLNKPGCPPPIDNFLTQHRVGGLTAGDCALRTPTSTPGPLNNVAVPGATSLSPTATVPGPDTLVENALTTFILGGETQIQRAAEAQPTFVSAWIGNNDVLNASLSGILQAAPGISNGVTSLASFTTNYEESRGGAQGNPIDQGRRADRCRQHGERAAALSGCRAATILRSSRASMRSPDTPRRSTQRRARQRRLRSSTSSWPEPSAPARIRQRSTAQPLPAPFAPLGNVYVLDAAEQAAVTDTVSAYNALIAAEADSLGFAYFDPNPALVQLKTSGAVPIFPDLAQPTAPFGPYFSLDGVHPAAAAHVLLANLHHQCGQRQVRDERTTYTVTCRGEMKDGAHRHLAGAPFCIPDVERSE